jgi:pyruvate,water dikinase
MAEANEYIRWFEDLKSDHVSAVGGKNASLGEMIAALKEEGVRVPGGFATTARAYRDFLDHNDLNDRIRETLNAMNGSEDSLRETGRTIREMIEEGEFPDEVDRAVRDAYRRLCERLDKDPADVAVRSSATAEDLPEASFAGQQETYLNVTGEEAVLDACRRCYASLFTDRAIRYREEQDFDHMDVALSAGVQQMVRSDIGSAGVIFTLGTETGFPDVVVINAAWGLGETVVQGTITPDEFRVFKPRLDREGASPIIRKRIGRKQKKIVYAESGGETTEEVETDEDERRRPAISDEDALKLARWACAIERHYGRPMDIEWARDGETDELFIVQARPETVQSQKAAATLKTYELTDEGDVLLEGLAIGQAIASGKAFVLHDLEQADTFEKGGILVTDMTDPDWVPIMEQADGIITDHGGRTSHAAIVSRELGVPAVIGTEHATEHLETGRTITLSCAHGEIGRVYDGELDFEVSELRPDDVPDTETDVMMILASPEAAFRWWNLPVDGIGLARMEFVLNNIIRVHPLALLHFDQVESDEDRRRIEEITEGYGDKAEYFVDQLARGIARIAASQFPGPCIVRLSDFKTNEYADLIGGSPFEPDEPNPMLGFRGAARYYSERYREAFALECRAIRRARQTLGLDNVIAMIPFCRTLEEADRCLDAMAEHGLQRGESGFQVYVMAETPSNVLLAAEFAKRFDGFSIGTNDLTQLVLGVDRDSEQLAHLFDERNPAVKRMVRDLIDRAHEAGTKVGLCGQAPSDHPDFAAFLVEAGIDSISVNPDSVLDVRRAISRQEQEGGGSS